MTQKINIVYGGRNRGKTWLNKLWLNKFLKMEKYTYEQKGHNLAASPTYYEIWYKADVPGEAHYIATTDSAEKADHMTKAMNGWISPEEIEGSGKGGGAQSIRARILLEVVGGLIPGTRMPEYTKRFAISSDQWNAEGLFEGRKEEAEWQIMRVYGLANEYMRTLWNPARCNWVQCNWIWL